MNRRQLLQRIDTAWLQFVGSFAGLPEARLLDAGVAGDWSVKDVIAHVTWWEEEALKHLPLIVAGGTPPRYSQAYGGIDAFNALMHQRTRHRSLAEVRANAEATHARLIELIQSVSEDHIATETRFRRRLRLDTYGHYPLHTEMIRAWRENRSGQ